MRSNIQKYFSSFLLFFFSVCLINAQHIQNPGFIRLTEPFEFNLPQFGVGLSLPAKAGFMVSVISGKEVMMNIDNKTTYSFSLDYLNSDKTNFFRFSLSDDASYMQLNINAVLEFDKIKYIEKKRHSEVFVKTLKSIKSELGESVSFQIKKGGSFYDEYVFYKDGFLYTFSVESDLSDKNDYMRLISDFKEKNLKQDKITYENRVKYGYYDKEKKKPTVKPDEGGHEYRKITGKMQQDGIVELPNLYMSINVPSGWVYEFEGRTLVHTDDNKLTLNVDDLDKLNNSMILVWLRGEGMNFMGRYSSKTNRNPVPFSNIGDGIREVYPFSGDVKLYVDGIEANGIYHGSPDIQSLDTWFETENGYYSFSASGVTTENLSYYTKLFDGLKIDSETPRDKKALTSGSQLSSILDVKEKSPVQLDELVFSSAKQVESFKCNFSTVGASLWLPGKVSDYKYGLKRTFGENPFVLDEGSASPIAPDYDNFFVYIYSSDAKYKVDCSIYLMYGLKPSVTEVVKDWIRSWGAIPDWNKVERAGVVKAKDGSEWGCLFVEGGKSVWILGMNDEYFIQLSISAESEQDILDICPLIYNFTFAGTDVQ